MSRGVEELIDVRDLSDDELQLLDKSLSEERARRSFMHAGLDSGEQLQFDIVVDMICERTKLGKRDALAMIQAHVPGCVRSGS